MPIEFLHEILRKRRAVSLAESLLLVIVMAGIGTTAWIASPFVLHAGMSSSDADNVRREDWPESLQQAADAIDTLVRKSNGTCLIKTSADDRRDIEFIALWMDDEYQPNRINQTEVVLLRYSRYLHSITAYAWEPTSKDIEKTGDPVIEPLLRNRRFAETFLRLPKTVGRVIAVNINAVRITATSPSDHSAQPILEGSPGRIQLTSRSLSADRSIDVSIPTDLWPAFDPTQ